MKGEEVGEVNKNKGGEVGEARRNCRRVSTGYERKLREVK